MNLLLSPHLESKISQVEQLCQFARKASYLWELHQILTQASLLIIDIKQKLRQNTRVWTKLPRSLFWQSMTFLGWKDWVATGCVCRHWGRELDHPLFLQLQNRLPANLSVESESKSFHLPYSLHSQDSVRILYEGIFIGSFLSGELTWFSHTLKHTRQLIKPQLEGKRKKAKSSVLPTGYQFDFIHWKKSENLRIVVLEKRKEIRIFSFVDSTGSAKDTGIRFACAADSIVITPTLIIGMEGSQMIDYDWHGKPGISKCIDPYMGRRNSDCLGKARRKETQKGTRSFLLGHTRVSPYQMTVYVANETNLLADIYGWHPKFKINCSLENTCYTSVETGMTILKMAAWDEHLYLLVKSQKPKIACSFLWVIKHSLAYVRTFRLPLDVDHIAVAQGMVYAFIQTSTGYEIKKYALKNTMRIG
jgi:hypothetical protein